MKALIARCKRENNSLSINDSWWKWFDKFDGDPYVCVYGSLSICMIIDSRLYYCDIDGDKIVRTSSSGSDINIITDIKDDLKWEEFSDENEAWENLDN